MSKKIILRIIIGVVLFFILLLALLPLIVRKTAISNSNEWIGRTISWEKFHINYFTSTVKLIDFKLFEMDDTTVFVGFDTLIVDAELYELFRNEIVVEQLYLKGLTTNVVMYDSAFNFDDLINRFVGDTDTTKIEKESIEREPLHFELSNLELKGAYITVKDAVIDKQMELSDLDFFVPYIGWNQEDKSEAGLKFNFKNGGYFQSSVNIHPNKGDFEASLTIKDLDISGYADFVAKYIDLGPFQGSTNLSVEVHGNMNNPEATKGSGSLQVNEFLLKDNNEKPIVGVQQLNVRLKEADPANNHFEIDTVSLLEPYVYFEMYDSTNNIVELINRALPPADSTMAKSKQPETETSEAKELYYAVHNFMIKDGIIDFVDSRTGDPFKYHLSALQVKTDSVSSTSNWMETQSTMLLNERGKLVAQLGINPKNPMDLKLDYTISDFMLSDLNIYSRFYMGFPILYGDMYYKAHTEIQDGQLLSENKIIIHNVELGNKSEGMHDLPIKFALFLLKDKDGVITLDVPVAGDLKNPSVSVGKIVWNTFKNLIIKAAAAPVKLLSGLIGADPKEIESIEYDFLDTTFTERRQKQLDLLLELEQQKQDLEIELIYFNDPDLEKSDIAMAEAGKLYEKKKNANYLDDKEGFEVFVRNELKSDTISILDGCKQLVEQSVVDSIFDAFNRKRIQSLESYLHQNNDSTEILVIKSKLEAPKNVGSKPIFEVKYGMKEEKLP